MRDLTGQVFGKLTVVKFGERKGPRYYWICRCECGNEKSIEASNFKNGKSKSCGCMVGIRTRERMLKHGMYKTKIIKIWNSMKQRCYNKNDRHYYNYGARGIKVEWCSFEDFWADMGDTYKEGLSIERINGNGNYCKENCKRATRKEQQNNTRQNVKINIEGEIKPLYDWCNQYKINYSTVTSRVGRGWDYVRAVTEPIKIN